MRRMAGWQLTKTKRNQKFVFTKVRWLVVAIDDKSDLDDIIVIVFIWICFFFRFLHLLFSFRNSHNKDKHRWQRRCGNGRCLALSVKNKNVITLGVMA